VPGQHNSPGFCTILSCSCCYVLSTYIVCPADAGGPPALFGIVILTDEGYAGSPGGRPELVVAASSPELQVRQERQSWACTCTIVCGEQSCTCIVLKGQGNCSLDKLSAAGVHMHGAELCPAHEA
jgi:hypothetical protein